MVNTDKSKILYTFVVLVSFDVQFAFTDSEVQPTEEDGKGDIDPSEEALTRLQEELKEYLSKEYYIDGVPWWASVFSPTRSDSHRTFNVPFSFTTQFTFTGLEIQQAEEGGEGDVDPSDEALATLEEEIKEYLSKKYLIGRIEVSADFDDLLGVFEDFEH